MPEAVTTMTQRFELWTFTGQATGVGTYSTTNVTGSGTAQSVSIKSTTDVHTQFHIQLDSGVEKPISLKNVSFSIANGNKVSVVLATRIGEQQGYYVALRNHTTGTVTPVREGLDQAFSSKLGVKILVLFVVGLLIVSLVWALISIINIFASSRPAGSLYVQAFASCIVFAGALWYLRVLSRDVRTLQSAAMRLIERL